jgi:Flp pilus assembly pilin Flp
MARLFADDRGATMPEYAFMVALIAAVAFAGAELIGVNVLGKLTDFANSF